MKLKQLITKIMNQWSEITNLDFALTTWDGQEYLSPEKHKLPSPEKMQQFAQDDALSKGSSTVHFFKVFRENTPTYILIVWGKGTQAHTIGELAVCQIQSLLENEKEKLTKNDFLQNLLLDQYTSLEIQKYGRKLHLSLDKSYAVFVIETKQDAEEYILTTIGNIFSARTGHYITSLDVKNIILISELSSTQDYDSLEKIAHTLVDMLASEAMVAAWVAYGNIAADLSHLSQAYKEAHISLEVGKTFTPSKNTFGYRHLGMGHLIYHLPEDVCKMFIEDIFKGESLKDLDQDTLDLIHTFFESNLNLSETARKLYLHRNTLVYRIEKLEKRFGLDIRKFEDAMTFKVAMMIVTYMDIFS